MIICRSKGFIFLRVPKTASSSISKQLCSKIKFGKDDAYSDFAGYPALNIQKIEDRKGEHATLSQFLKSKIISNEDIDKLKIYGVLRNPIDRSLSMFAHVLKNFENVDISTFTKNDIIESGLKLFYNSPIKYHYCNPTESSKNYIKLYPLLPQTFWLNHNDKPIENILLYPNFSEFLKKYTGTPKLNFNLKVGKKYDDFQKVNSSYVVELKKIYHEDFVMWEIYSRTFIVTY